MLRFIFLLTIISLPHIALAEIVNFNSSSGGNQTLTIYSSTDTERIEALINTFQAQYPDINVVYHLLDTVEIYRRTQAEIDTRKNTADLLLSSAMDLQIKLVNDGYTQAYHSAEITSLPKWANWRNEAFGFTYEPAAIVYNKTLLPNSSEITTRFELAQMLVSNAETLQHKVVTYDPERSGLGYLFATQDAIRSEDFWYLVRSLGETRAQLETSSSLMISKVTSGEAIIAYNVLGSYARALDHPALGIIFPNDYSLVMSRIAVIPRGAKNTEAAGKFIDFLISRQGQTLIASTASLYSLREDIQGESTAASLRNDAAGPVTPIRLGPGLLVYLDTLKRNNFISRWRRAIRTSAPRNNP